VSRRGVEDQNEIQWHLRSGVAPIGCRISTNNRNWNKRASSRGFAVITPDLFEESGVKYKFFYGMSSSYAMKNNYAANNNINYRSSEGREIKVKYKGTLDDTVQNYLGGLRSTCTYTNSSEISSLSSNCKFILVNTQYNSNLVNGK
jgi:hypothetical protein